MRVQIGKKMPALMAIPLILLAAGVVILGVWPSLVNGLTLPAARALLVSIGGWH